MTSTTKVWAVPEALFMRARQPPVMGSEVLMLVPRAKDGGEWMKRSQELINTGEAAIRAIDAKNADRLFTVGGDIYEACSSCHRQYMEAIVNANK